MRRIFMALSLLVAAAAPSFSLARAADRPAPSTPAPATTTAGDSCRRMPEGKRLRLNLKPNTSLVDLVSWISAITCKQFVVPGELPAHSKTVTIIAPQPITVAEAYALFLDALDANGLTVYRSGQVLRVVETAKIGSRPIPVYVDGED
jgi:type II secretory pathway component GspD/PulD (secretin)